MTHETTTWHIGVIPRFHTHRLAYLGLDLDCRSRYLWRWNVPGTLYPTVLDRRHKSDQIGTPRRQLVLRGRAERHGVWDDGGVVNGTRLTCTPSPSVEQVTLTWTDTSDATHNIVYSIVEGELQKAIDGAGSPMVLATGVVANSISFTLCGNTLRLNLDVLADRNTTDKLDLITYVRKLS